MPLSSSDDLVPSASVVADLVLSEPVHAAWADTGLEAPTFPDETVRRVVGLHTDVAVDRHGQAAVVRTPSRPQRAPASVSAF